MKVRSVKFTGSHPNGFTLLELLAAIAILAIMITLLFAAFGQASRAWLQSENRVESFSQARAVLDIMSREISQAIVNSNITFLGDAHDIAFVAPVNTGTNAVDLIEVVYRLSQVSLSAASVDPGNIFTNVANEWPKKLVRRMAHFGAATTEGWDYGLGATTTTPWDFYTGTGGTPNPNWPETSASNRTVVLAENVMGLTFQYFDATNSNVENYWNSNAAVPPPPVSWRHELRPPILAGTIGPGGPGFNPIMTNRAPASVQIILTMIDSKAAARLQGLGTLSTAFVNITNQALKVFSTVVSIPNR